MRLCIFIDYQRLRTVAKSFWNHCKVFINVLQIIPADRLEQFLVLFDLRVQLQQLVDVCLYVCSVRPWLSGQQVLSADQPRVQILDSLRQLPAMT